MAIVAATGDEAEPAAANYDAVVPPHWRYRGRVATQYWRAPAQAGLIARVNGRATFWATMARIPGGISFENFELQAPFTPGQEFSFSVIPAGPDELGFQLPK